MLIKVDITKEGIITHSATFGSQVEADAWVAQEQANLSWGRPGDYTVTETNVTQSAGLESLRAKRNALISACDWTQLPDAPLTTESKAEFAAYRQALRDLPSQPGLDVLSPAWPTPPVPVSNR